MRFWGNLTTQSDLNEARELREIQDFRAGQQVVFLHLGGDNEQQAPTDRQRDKQTAWRLTCKLQAGYAAEDGAPGVEGRALVKARVLVPVRPADDQAAAGHVSPVVPPQVD